MSIKDKFNRFTRLIGVLVFAFFSLFLTSPASAQENAECTEANLRARGVVVVSCDEDANVSNQCSTVGNAQGSGLGNRVFVIGDSLTYGMANRGNLMGSLAAEGFSVSPDFTITDKSSSSPRVSGVSIEATGGINTADSIPKLEEHAQDFSEGKADIILVGLGTNKESNFIAKVKAFTTYLKSKNQNATIVWVNTYYTSENRSTSYTTVNSDLAEAAVDSGLIIIDLAKAAEQDELLRPDGGDGVHYSTDGFARRSVFISKELKKITQPGSQTVNTGSGGSPLALTFPALANESQVANNLTNYIKTEQPESPWLSVSSNIGQWLFEKSKEMNVNPLLVASIGKQENQFGTSSSTSVRNYNYFGMKDTKRDTDPRIGGIKTNDIPGSDYIGFDSAAEGIEFFIRYLAINTQGDNRGLYVNVQNFYEYIAMHQAGQIAYPGEPLRGGDSEMDVAFSWESNWNPKIYYENSIEFINELTGLSLSPVPTRGAAPAGCIAGGGNGSGLIDSTGYSFPLDLKAGNISGVNIGQATTNHHDGTPAFDLVAPNGPPGGDEVYAIYSGTISKISEQDPGWCYSIQFLADDGYYYWYGHLNSVTVTEGQRVGAGEKLGEVAQWVKDQHTCNGTSTGTHLHIDRGCTIDVGGTPTPQTGGSKECRDPDFIPFFSALYERLKEATSGQ